MWVGCVIASRPPETLEAICKHGSRLCRPPLRQGGEGDIDIDTDLLHPYCYICNTGQEKCLLPISACPGLPGHFV